MRNGKLFIAMLLAATTPSVLTQTTTGGTDVVHIVSGVVDHVDKTTKTLFVKSADGTKEAYHYTDKTTVHAANTVGHNTKDATVDTAHGLQSGSHILVHYTGEGADKTASGIDQFGHATVKDAHGTIVHVDKAAGTMTVKMKDGTVQTFHMSKDATIDTGHGIEKFGDASADDIKQGAGVTVHYTESAGQKIIHTFEKL